MQHPEGTPDLQAAVRAAVNKTEFFSRLQEKQREQVIEKAGVLERYAPDEALVKTGEPGDSLFVIVTGEVGIVVGQGDDAIELTRLGPGQLVGEMAVLLEETRTASVIARAETTIMRISRDVFRKILVAIPGAGLAMMRLLAERLKKTSKPPAHRDFAADSPIPPVEVLRLIPSAFMQRHRVAPVRLVQNKLLLGCCDTIDQTVLNAVANMLPSMRVETVTIDLAYFNKILQNFAGDAAAGAGEAGEGSGAKHVDDLLRRLVEEGGSDLHLPAGQVPRWRIDGEITPIAGFNRLGPEEVLRLLRPVMSADAAAQFEQDHDGDFAYAMDRNSRFRINLLRDHRGVSAVFRHIPNTIFSLAELGMPEILARFCGQTRGLVLVSGAAGSGRSTTLAAMVDHINRNRKCHILTLEDPIEFVHESASSLVTQREVGPHTRSFARALRAALREDPDVVMVGALADRETIAMALETANTGRLVLAAMHTATAATTLDGLVGQFPADAQVQVRTLLADTLVGVVCQTLCRKIGGGRVPALEILVNDHEIAGLVREGKTHNLPGTMIMGQAKGNRLLNDELQKLVAAKKVAPEEALARSCDRRELEKKLGGRPA